MPVEQYVLDTVTTKKAFLSVSSQTVSVDVRKRDKDTRQSSTRNLQEYLDSKCQSKQTRNPGIFVNIDTAGLCGDYKNEPDTVIMTIPCPRREVSEQNILINRKYIITH